MEQQGSRHQAIHKTTNQSTNQPIFFFCVTLSAFLALLCTYEENAAVQIHPDQKFDAAAGATTRKTTRSRTRSPPPRAQQRMRVFTDVAEEVDDVAALYMTYKAPARKRMLVFTDVGEEVDDEAALYMMYKVLHSRDIEVDVVFTTGLPRVRAKRWACILDSLEKPRGNISYYVGPDSDRHMRYEDAAGCSRGNVSHLSLAPFKGGEYDVVMQMSPLFGFESPKQAPKGPLASMKPRSGAQFPVTVLVGDIGSTNFDDKDCSLATKKPCLHGDFKEHLINLGFSFTIVQAENYAKWNPSYLTAMPSVLAEMIRLDEWNKAVGRIPPGSSNLLVRFNVNAVISFKNVRQAFDVFMIKAKAEKRTYVAVTRWWNHRRADKVLADIRKGYVAKCMRGQAGVLPNTTVAEFLEGKPFSWESLEECAADILKRNKLPCLQAHDSWERKLGACLLKDVISEALFIITERLMTIWAFAKFMVAEEPEGAAVEAYVNGEPPLNFKNFPPLPLLRNDSKQWLLDIQNEVVGNPQYDPSGMLVALAMLATNSKQSEQQRLVIRSKLDDKKPLLSQEGRLQAMSKAYGGAAPADLLNLLTPEP